MSSSAIGLVFLLIFALSQGVRDALFGNVFQSVSFFLVAALAFGASTLCFSGLALLRQPKDFRRLATSPAMFAALNMLTAVAWLSFFFGLKWLEPAVVATLYNGIGPLTILVIGGLGWIQAKGKPSVGAPARRFRVPGEAGRGHHQQASSDNEKTRGAPYVTADTQTASASRPSSNFTPTHLTVNVVSRR
jgi:hypothetical protein